MAEIELHVRVGDDHRRRAEVARLKTHLDVLAAARIEMLRLAEFLDRIDIARGDDVERLLVAKDGLGERQVVGKVGRLQDQRPLRDQRVERVDQPVPFGARRADGDRDRDDGRIGKETRDVGEECGDPVLPCEQIQFLDQRFVGEQRIDRRDVVGTRPNTVSKGRRVVAKGRCDRLK